MLMQLIYKVVYAGTLNYSSATVGPCNKKVLNVNSLIYVLCHFSPLGLCFPTYTMKKLNEPCFMLLPGLALFESLSCVLFFFVSLFYLYIYIYLSLNLSSLKRPLSRFPETSLSVYSFQDHFQQYCQNFIFTFSQFSSVLSVSKIIPDELTLFLSLI